MLRRLLIAGCASCCLITGSGCVGAGDASGAPTVTDSAGVRIVYNTTSRFERDGRAWSVSAEPGVVIGSMTGDEAYLFDRIMGVERLSDGRWAVADMGSSQIRYYDEDGTHLYSAGRNGDGPGEFQQVMGMHLLRGDTIAVDDGRLRFQLIDEKGQFAGMISSAGSFIDARTYPAGSFGDGTLVGATLSGTPQRLTEPHTMTWSISRIRLTRDGAAVQMVVDTIGTWGAIRLVPGWRGSAQAIEFDSPTQVGIMSAGIAVADPVRNEIRLHGTDGALHAIVRREWTPVPVTSADIEERRSQFINMRGEGGGQVPPGLLQQRTDITETWTVAEHMPAFSVMSIDDADNVWLRNYVANEQTIGDWRPSPVTPTRWTLISADGILLGEVELPARFVPHVFGDDFIAGVYRDDAHVEYIHVYQLEK